MSYCLSLHLPLHDPLYFYAKKNQKIRKKIVSSNKSNSLKLKKMFCYQLCIFIRSGQFVYKICLLQLHLLTFGIIDLSYFSFRYNHNNVSSRSDSNSDCPSDNELKGSMDIHPDMDFGLYILFTFLISLQGASCLHQISYVLRSLALGQKVTG